MTQDSSSNNVLEVGSAVVLALAALLTSWASYQASLWDGEQAAHYSRANALRIQSTRAGLEGDARQAVEMAMFFQWLDAEARGDRRLAKFYQGRLPADLKPAFNDWLRDHPLANPSAAPTPFHEGSYHLDDRVRSAQLERDADLVFDRGQRDNAISDAFVQASTIISMAMFFAGIGQIFRMRAARIGLLVMAVAAVSFGVVRLIGLPIQVLGFGPPT